MLAADQPEAGAPPGIPNFAWVEAGRVARGQQPALTLSAYRELRVAELTSVLSLRAEREYLDDERRRYDVADERSLCAALELRYALASQPLVSEQGRRSRSAVCARQDGRERHTILNRLIGALAKVRKHWMRGIAEQSDAPMREARQRLAPEQRPFVGLGDVADDGVNVVVPAAKVSGAFFAAAALGPGFHPPVAFDNADKIEDLTSAQQIIDDVATRTDPVDADIAPHVRRQFFDWHKPAPRHATGELRLVVADENIADARMHTVGSDQRVEYTAIGDTTNTASRPEGMTKGTDTMVLIPHTTRERLRAAAPQEELVHVGEVEIRGRTGTLAVYTLPAAARRPAAPEPGRLAI